MMLAFAILFLTSGQAMAAAPDVTTNVVVYSLNGNGGANKNGNLGGRAGADALCLASGSKPTTGAVATTQYRALISVDANDEIRDMPTKYSLRTDQPIVGNYPAGSTIAIASNVGALIAGPTLSNTMQTATGATNVGYWTGSDNNGALVTNCSGWTSSTAGALGQVGTHNVTTTGWLNGGWYYGTPSTDGDCSTLYNLLCVAFTPAVVNTVSAPLFSTKEKAAVFSEEVK